MGRKAKKVLSLLLSVTIILCVFTVIPPVKSFAAQTVSSTVPAEYESYVAALKKAHPTWKFEFLYTGLDWNTVIENEAVNGRSLVSYTFPKSYRAIDSSSYNSSTDSYIAKDGTSWFNAEQSVIKYYMDPRNFLDEINVFQFEKLSYDSKTQTLDGIKSMLKGSFMDNVYISNGTSNVLYAQAFLDAATRSGASPYHLVSKVLQEVGKSGSGSTTGKNANYPGIYNFYNIGASSGTNPVENGLSWASSTTAGDYLRPWNSQYKSIIGGALYISKNYISNGQDTIYLEKFDVETAYSGTYWHQYMTNISGAYTEGQKVYNAYKDLKLLETDFTFVIPVYNNFPSSKCNLPISAGSPYCWLSSLTVDNYSVTPASTLQVETNNYSVTVPYSASSVTITAKPYNSSAKVTGLSNSVSSSTATGHVTGISTNLRVRTSAGVSSPNSDSNRLLYSGNYVGLENGTSVTILGQQTVSGVIWYNIRFSYQGATLSGWVSSEYITRDSSTTSQYQKVNLNVGANTFNIVVTGKSGETRTYILTITRSADSSSSPSTGTLNGIKPTVYTLDTTNKFIQNITKGTSVSAFKTNLNIQQNTTVNVLSGSTVVTSGNVGTGMIMRVNYLSSQTEYQIAVTGDVTGDGAPDIFDIIKTRNHILGTSKVSGIYFKAMDVDSNGEVDIFDLIKIRNMALS